jgi:dCTP deaminase
VILSDRDIVKRIKDKSLVIKPFKPNMVQPSTVDLTLHPKVLVFNNYQTGLIDVRKKQDISKKVNMGKNGWFVVHPGEFILGSTVERVSIPKDLAAKLEGKSSLGRLGLIVHATAGYVDPGFQGDLTLEISNISNLPIKLYAHMKIAQIAFHQMSSEVLSPYGRKKLGSKYQGQKDPTASKIWKDFK